MEQPAIPAPADQPAVVDRSSFIQTFKVREGVNHYEVAANAVANKAMMQVNVAKLRDLAERAIKPYIDNPSFAPDAKSLKAIVDAFDTIEDLAARAYSDSKAGKNANMLERLVEAATRGAAEGATKAPQNKFAERLERMKRVGQKAAEAVQPSSLEVME